VGVYPLFIYFEGEILIVSLIVLLDLCLIWTLFRASERPTGARWLLSGLVLGLSAIARPNILILVPFVIFWIAFLLRRKTKLRATIFSVAVFCAGVALCMAPVLIRNYAVGRDFVPIASQAGINFYIGNNPDSDGMAAVAPDMKKTWWGGYHDAIRIAEESIGHPPKASEVSDFWLSKGMQFIREQPARWMLLTLKKFHLFWSGYEIPNNQDIYFFGGYSSLFKALVWRRVIACPFGILAPLALAGIVISLFSWRRFLLLHGFTFLYMLSVIAFFVCSRYRMPVIPFLVIFASLAVTQWIVWVRAAEYRKLMLSACLVLVLFVLLNVDFYGAGRSDTSQSYFNLGRVYQEQELYGKATAQYRKALRLNPHYAEPHVNLGRIARETDQLDVAIREYKEAIRLDPSLPEPYNNLGNIYAQMKRYEEAEVEFNRALTADSRYFRAYNNLGNLYLVRGMYSQAVEMYSEAVRIDPRYESALYNRGLAYYRMGEYERAIHQWQELLRIASEPGDIRRRIGEAEMRLQEEE
jgi:tetratricopeptide (TPR) repeat protein